MVVDAPVVRDVVVEGIEPGRPAWIVRMRAAVCNDRERLAEPLDPGPDSGRDYDQGMVVGPEKPFEHGPRRGRAGAVVVERELHSAVDARVVERHLAVLVPALDDPSVDAREIDLAELDEMGIVGSEHVEDRAALVRDSPQRDYLATVDHSLSGHR